MGRSKDGEDLALPSTDSKVRGRLGKGMDTGAIATFP